MCLNYTTIIPQCQYVLYKNQSAGFYAEYKKIDASNAFDINNMSARRDAPFEKIITSDKQKSNSQVAQTSSADIIQYAENNEKGNEKKYSLSDVDKNKKSGYNKIRDIERKIVV